MKKKELGIDTQSEKDKVLIQCPFCYGVLSVSKKKLREILSKGEYVKGKI